MGVGEGMMALGIGCRKGTPTNVVLAVIDEALRAQGLTLARPLLVATGSIKAEEDGIREAAHQLDAEFVVLSDDALQAAASRTLTRSEMSLAHTGLPSLSEAAALAAAGPNARLLGPRHVSQGVTCAIALSEEKP